MKRRRMRSREEWERVIQEQAGSGVAVAEFCRREDVGMSSFYHWKRRLGEDFEVEATSKGESFIDMGRVAAATPASAGSLVVRLDLGGGATLTIERG